jgi:hypothetical protein
MNDRNHPPVERQPRGIRRAPEEIKPSRDADRANDLK